MTVLRSTFQFRSLLQIAALGLLLLSHAARAADEQDGGSFSTPGTSTGAPRQSETGTEFRARPDSAAITNQQRTQGGPTSADTAPGARSSSIVRAEAPLQRAELPPPKPSEFQKFVQTATGRLLPVFGSSFFTAPAESFAPVDNVPVSADYTVGPGDEIVLRAWGSIDIDYRSTVDRNGQLNLPRIGSFTVAGVKASDLEKQLRSQIGRMYTNFNLSVSLGRLHGVKVFVVGTGKTAGRVHAEQPVDAAVGRRGRWRAGPERLDAQDQPAPRRAHRFGARRRTSSSSRATSRRTFSSWRATSWCSTRSARGWRSMASSTTRRSTS